MKETKYYCDRCKDVFENKSEELPIQIKISIISGTGYEDIDMDIRDVCHICYLRFISDFNEFFKIKKG